MDSSLVVACATLLVALVVWRLVKRNFEYVKILSVIDGDTVFAITTSGKKSKLRLQGIDAPETGQPRAKEAKAHLESRTKGQWVRVRWHGYDRYNRRLASIYLGRENVAADLVRRGLVFAANDGGLSRYELMPKLLWRGVHKPWQPSPEKSVIRKLPLIGWLRARRATRLRKKHVKRDSRGTK